MSFCWIITLCSVFQVFLTPSCVMETAAVPRTLIRSTMTVPNSVSSYTYSVPKSGLCQKTHKTPCCQTHRLCVGACCSVTFSLATLWENGQVPSACLHVPRRNLHRNNGNGPENTEGNGAVNWKQLLVLEVFLHLGSR